jgi:hypothetical protein
MRHRFVVLALLAALARRFDGEVEADQLTAVPEYLVGA